MFLSWLRRRRRRKIAQQPFPEAWHRILENNVHQYARMSQPHRKKLQRHVQILVAEKNWEGCGGLQLSDEIRVTIAGMAGLVTLGFEDEYYAKVLTILVYPDIYVAQDQTVMHGGVVLEGHSQRLGEAWYRGPVIVSWKDARRAGRNPDFGRNVVVHEFAHQLDMQNDRYADGIPPMRSLAQLEHWEHVMEQGYRKLAAHCQRGIPTAIDCYGTTSMSEFFAVACETFFQWPEDLREEFPELYAAFCDYFNQDPAAW